MSIPIGTTPTFVLTFTDQDLDLTQAAHVYVDIAGAADIEKSDGDLTVEEKQISVYLTQAETLSLGVGTVQIQVNWTGVNGTRAASEIVTYYMGANLLNRVVE